MAIIVRGIGGNSTGKEVVGVEAQGFCVKCRAKRKMQNAKEIMTKNRRKAVQGTCPVCGTKMFKFLPMK